MRKMSWGALMPAVLITAILTGYVSAPVLALHDPGTRHHGPNYSQAKTAINNLINLVNSLNIPKGQTASLDAKLQAALNSLNRGQGTAAANQLNAFIHEVNAQCCTPVQGKVLTSVQAAQLTTTAAAIIQSL